MRLDVKYAARVRPGDLVAGHVEPNAPTRPVQPMASAMRSELRDVSHQEIIDHVIRVLTARGAFLDAHTVRDEDLRPVVEAMRAERPG